MRYNVLKDLDTRIIYKNKEQEKCDNKEYNKSNFDRAGNSGIIGRRSDGLRRKLESTV